ncbi:MAG: flagellar basal body L-ring protein FlgH [bacterium]
MKRIISIVSILAFLMNTLIPVQLMARSLWKAQEGRGAKKNSSYSSNVAVHEGDILLIQVDESTNAQTDSTKEREKETEVGGEANAGGPGSTVFNEIASWIPLFGATMSGSSEYESERTLDASGSLNTQMSVRVEEVHTNGILKLKGKRKIKIEDEIRNLTFVGYARKSDVTPNNTIPSERIANAEIFVEGELGLRDGEARTFLGKSWKFMKNIMYW